MISKKFLLIGSGIFVLLIALVILFYFLRENRYVTFNIDYPEGSAVISDTSDASKKFATIKNGSSLWLGKKSYYIFFENEKLDKNPTSITVNDQTGTVKLDPNLSGETLGEMLESEQATIQTKIRQSITSTGQYTLDRGTLYHRGEWYSTQIHIYKVSSLDPEIGNPADADTYYLVLKKGDSGWNIAAGPSLIITKPDYPSIPSYIIDAINPVNAVF